LEETPQTAVTELTVLSEEEHHQVLELYNATEADYPRQKLIHELFEEQVTRTPSAPAVTYAGRSFSYSELNAKSNQLAHDLRARGIGPYQLVGICAERSLEMVIGLLGILKAGAAYVPLDPNYPGDRLRYMLEDAAPKILLTQTRLKGRLPETPAEIIPLDTLASQTADLYTETSPSAGPLSSSDNLVYVIYTSGSTGRPKSTAMPHRAMINLIEWHRRTLRSCEGKNVLQFAALSFDVAFQEIFSTLCSGGNLVLLDEWVRRDARALTELLLAQSIHRLFIPPMALQSLAEFCAYAGINPTSLQDVITAGEQLRVTPEVIRLFKELPGCQLHNHYGPTETHVVTALTLSGDPATWPSLPTIGFPIQNARIYILDSHCQPVPVGVVGEIYIGGAGLARGYLNRPELTAERFIRDPFRPDPHARMYKTGDLARWRPDGVIEYLGRNDDQVKLRGFRIELGEIESQLLGHPEVKEAVVVAIQDDSADKRLVAYVVPRTTSGTHRPVLDMEGLRNHLKTTLPDHMIPSAFVTLERLPLTPNGKLDRKALPAPDSTAYLAGSHYEAPEGEIEEILARIWQSLLRVERIGRNDNFFELGGHSLYGMKVAMNVAEQLGVDVPIITIFRHPTLRQMAQYIQTIIEPENLETAGTEFEEGVL